MLIIVSYIYIALSYKALFTSVPPFDLLNSLVHTQAGMISPTLQMRKLVPERLSHLPCTTQLIEVEIGLQPSCLNSYPSKFSMSILYLTQQFLGMRAIGRYISFCCSSANLVRSSIGPVKLFGYQFTNLYNEGMNTTHQ